MKREGLGGIHLKTKAVGVFFRAYSEQPRHSHDQSQTATVEQSDGKIEGNPVAASASPSCGVKRSISCGMWPRAKRYVCAHVRRGSQGTEKPRVYENTPCQVFSGIIKAVFNHNSNITC